MSISRDSLLCKHRIVKQSKSPEKQIIPWLRKRISFIGGGESTIKKTGFWYFNSERKVMRFYEKLRAGERGHYLYRLKNQGYMNHFMGRNIAYFTADGRRACPETLLEIDLDVHARGSYAGAVSCVEWLIANGFPNLFYSRSTNQRGIHAYVRVAKGRADDKSVDEAFLALQRWLKLQLEINAWDISGIEVKGRPPVMDWGTGRYELLSVNMGSLAKLPVEAMDRPLALMNTTILTVKELNLLGDLETGLRHKMLLKEAETLPSEMVVITSETSCHGESDENTSDSVLVAVPATNSSTEDFSDLTGRPCWLPNTRHREWPLWIMHVGRHGFQEGQDVGTVLHELAKWLLWVELYDSDDSKELAVDLLTQFVANKHNDVIRRVNAGRMREIETQIKQAVKSASKISTGKSVFTELRQRRANGTYKKVFMVAPLLTGVEKTGQDRTDSNTLSIYSGPLRNDAPLPTQLESQIELTAKKHRHRRIDGQYPIVRFARRFLNALWESGGQARIGQDDLNAMAGTVKHEQQTAYKALLRDAGLIEDFDGTYRKGTANTLYTLSGEVKAWFAEQHRSPNPDRMTPVRSASHEV